jgi:hypothetical protein
MTASWAVRRGSFTASSPSPPLNTSKVSARTNGVTRPGERAVTRPDAFRLAVTRDTSFAWEAVRPPTQGTV